MLENRCPDTVASEQQTVMMGHCPFLSCTGIDRLLQFSMFSVRITVARWPKILQNNSKGAAKNIFWPRKIGGRTAPNFGQKWQKRGWKILSYYFQFLQGQFGQKVNFWCFGFGLIKKQFLTKPFKNTKFYEICNLVCFDDSKLFGSM